ncbi:hypothetical protein Glove_300g18 [Diversispora epigaea]|uniref:Protein kinase domain-containing protein n=1 Tax=Diversispora epigaea TaxID=1348612 RepID=A0A397I2I2_9GLOM|nr:hypothetical protein Glove_300g18 [Diversispora epigaea]
MENKSCNENGTTIKDKEIFQWCLKSAEGANSNAKYYLGVCYENGLGTTKDEEKAFQWYLKSAELGNITGKFDLGRCYQYGTGTTKDEEKAFQWYLKSAEGGNSDGQCNLGLCYDNGIGVTKDEEKAFQWYLKSAEKGNNVAQYDVGCCYEHGTGTIKDEEKAFQWYLKSAEGGNIIGQYNLGNCYRYGIGTTKDEEKAFHWFLKSAEGGNSDGQNNVGYCYQHGFGTTKDEEKTFQWLMKSAEAGNITGQYNLARCYQHEIGTTIDEEKAFQWYLKSAEGKNIAGQYNLGLCYNNGIGTTKDEEKAFHWFLKSAEGGNSDGQNNVGYCYQHGFGTTKDKEKAFQWYLKSAEGGNSDGQYNLGLCYDIGRGTRKNGEKAFQWYMKSAEGGNIAGQYNLGGCYQYGIGTTRDDEKAFQWYIKSAEGGNIDGQCSLGYCYLNGIGTTKDKEKAVQWLLKSAEKGNDRGQQLIESLYRYEFGISTIKKYQNKLKQNTNRKEDISLALSKPPIIEDLNIKNYACCICWQRNGCNEICNKNFQDFGRCHNCGNLNIRKNVCKDCKSLELEYILHFSTGNDNKMVNTIIQMTELDENAEEWEIWRWIDYNKLKDIKYLDKGAFGTIWKAEWKDMPEELFEICNSNQVALKKLINSKKLSREFLRELLANSHCHSKFVLPIFGITQDPETMEYVVVLRYMKNGNLRNFLQPKKILPWIERLWLLDSFISGLEVIHDKGYIHCDLHPGNLMITEAFNNLTFLRVGDLGFCRPADEITTSGRYGVLPYIAPEILNQNEYTQASDIYSVGIIMWVISTGNIPFSDRAYDLELTLEILNGLRPKIKEGTPQCYVKLMKKCWHKDPSERPRAKFIKGILTEWISDLTFDEKAGTSLEFLNANQEIKNEDFGLLSTKTIHPEASLISKPLPLLPPLQYSNFNLSISNTDWNELLNNNI